MGRLQKPDHLLTHFVSMGTSSDSSDASRGQLIAYRRHCVRNLLLRRLYTWRFSGLCSSRLGINVYIMSEI